MASPFDSFAASEFSKIEARPGMVGIWYETYTVAPGQCECIYSNMPRFELAAAVRHASVTGRLDGARSRRAKAETASNG